MISRAYGLFITTLFGASLLLWMSSCTQLATRTDGRDAAILPSRHIAQLLIDGRSTYAVCEEPACPMTTRKILASDLQLGRPESLERPEASASPVAKPLAGASASNLPAPSAVGVAANAATEPASRPELIPPSPASKRLTAVNFAADSAVLTPQAKRALDRVMPWARQAKRIVIAGRTDSLGSEPLNQRLAFARALAVRDYIRDQIPLVHNTIQIDARGLCCFVATNSTAQGRLRNRRVEVQFRGLNVGGES